MRYGQAMNEGCGRNVRKDKRNWNGRSGSGKYAP